VPEIADKHIETGDGSSIYAQDIGNTIPYIYKVIFISQGTMSYIKQCVCGYYL